MTFSEKFACPVSGFTIPEIEPRLFSFNNPFGACPVCDGLGTEQKIDPNLIVSDVTLSLRDGAIVPWSKTCAPYYQQTLQAVVQALRRLDRHRLGGPAEEVQNAVLYGTGTTPINFVYDDGLRTYKSTKPFEGVIGNLERRYKETESAGMREEIEKYMSLGALRRLRRLPAEARGAGGQDRRAAYRPGQSEKSIRAAAAWFEDLPAKLSDTQRQIGERIFKEIRERLGFLNDVGLDYLTLARNSGSLSGGESQRIRLASQIGSGLTGVLYVLDEPSIGLHQRDNARLLETLRRLRDLGNTVIVVEHDEDAILTADYVVDIGPGAGVHGGHIVAEGHAGGDHPQSRAASPAQYLSGAHGHPDAGGAAQAAARRSKLHLDGATGNNLKNVSVDVPLGMFVADHRRLRRRQVDADDRHACTRRSPGG